MGLNIVLGTPFWVWGLLLALVSYGIAQTRVRVVGTVRLVVVPIVLAALSAAGALGAFGASPLAIGCWLAGLVASLALGRRLVAVVGAQPAEQPGTLRVPGSVVPMVLMLSLFVIKYAAGVDLAMHPASAHDPAFAAGFSAAYGVFAGLFLARAASMRRYLRPANVAPAV